MPLDIVPIFILPPSIEHLEVRLKKREEQNQELVKQRMRMAKGEITHWKDYKYIVINEDIENCFSQINQIIKVERDLRASFNNI
jgi:guanylate kinase